MRYIRVLRIILILTVTLILPLAGSKVVRAWMSGSDTDAVSSASVIVDAPSGKYVVIINKNLHTDEETLLVWKDFFEGKDIPVIFEDISCQVATSDAPAMDMATSLQSRLPENQMTVSSEDATLILSKAEYGKYDVIIFSEEVGRAYGVDEICDKPGTEVVHIG